MQRLCRCRSSPSTAGSGVTDHSSSGSRFGLEGPSCEKDDMCPDTDHPSQRRKKMPHPGSVRATGMRRSAVGTLTRRPSTVAHRRALNAFLIRARWGRDRVGTRINRVWFALVSTGSRPTAWPIACQQKRLSISRTTRARLRAAGDCKTGAKIVCPAADNSMGQPEAGWVDAHCVGTPQAPSRPTTR